MQYICNKLQLLSKIIFIAFCGKLKNGIYLRENDSIEYFFPVQIVSVIEFECLWIGSTEKSVFLFVFKNKNSFFWGMSHDASFSACENHSEQNRHSLTV